MRIEKVKIKNYKLFQDFTMTFNDDLNIIVGDNEAGKSTLLEAIGLALTSQIAGRNIQYELSPFLFNMGVVKEYIDGLQNNPATPLPQILIEVFLKEDFESELAQYKGTNNSERLDCAGVYFQIAFDKDYAPEYQAYIANASEVRTIPIEYYSCTWLSFANNTFKFSQLPSKIVLLDRSDQRLQNGSDKYIAKIIDDTLDKSESALLSLLYRKQKEILAEQDSMKKINERISANKEEITTRDLSVSIDISARSNWDANLSLYVDDVPFKFIGKGEQGAIKTKLALQTRMEKSQVIMIEQPETNLSYTNLNKLVSSLVKSCHEKQLIITTHSTFLMNKIGIDKVIFLNDGITASMTGVDNKTKQYFQKLPGYDTLRMIIARRSILVEGRSDELIVQKAYYQIHNKLPLDDGIDIITVGGLVFKRFMEIAQMLQKQIAVVTDNDGDYNAAIARYSDFSKVPNIKLCIDKDNAYPTLEPQLVKANGLAKMNKILGCNYSTEAELIKYMKAHKGDCALAVFEEGEGVNMPTYILDAIQ